MKTEKEEHSLKITKLKELTYVTATPYSSADFRHGPIALMEEGFPVLAVAPSGRVFEDMLTMIRDLRERQRFEHLEQIQLKGCPLDGGNLAFRRRNGHLFNCCAAECTHP